MNPFTPAFGASPPELIGRSTIIDKVIRGLELPTGNPYRAGLLIGKRGSGKTVMLSEISKIASMSGFIAVDVTVSQNFMLDIIEQLEKNAAHILDASPKLAGLGLTVLGVSGSLQFTKQRAERTWRSEISSLVDELNEKGVGVCILVDEIHKLAVGLDVLTTTYQHFVRENKNVAIFFAGLPEKIDELLSSSNETAGMTFIRRSYKIQLDDVGVSEVFEAYKNIFKEHEIEVEDDILESCAIKSGGYPYLIQLLGFYLYEGSLQSKRIDEGIANIAKREAFADLYLNVFDPIIANLTKKEVEIIKSIYEIGDDFVKIADIRKKLGLSPQYFNEYKKRLTNIGVIEQVGRGVISFAMPNFRLYLKERFD
jgi:hypothetical protein